MTQSLAEITVLAEKGGVSRHAFLEFLNNSVMGSVFTRYKSPAFVNLDFTPTFTPVLLRKDFDLALEAARKLEVPMPVAAITAAARAGQRRLRARRRGLCDPARTAGRRFRVGTQAGERRRRRRAVGCQRCSRAAAMTTSPPLAPAADPRSPPAHRYRRPGTWAWTTNSASTSTGCATTGCRARAALQASECGAFLLFDFYNIRYTTQTWIGGALGDKMTRYALLTRNGEPMLWDFGSAASHHRLHSPWLRPENCHAGMLGLRGAIAPTVRPDGRRGPADQGTARRCRGGRRTAGRRHRRAALPVRTAAPGLRVVDAQQAC